MKTLLRLAGIMVLLGGSAAWSAESTGMQLIEVRKIWDGAAHNAFTDLIRVDGAWYCVFREGSGHIPGTDGVIRVLRSADGGKWESAAMLTEKGVDLRDPKISLMPDGRLMIVMGGSIYDGDAPKPNRKRVSAWSRVSFSKDGKEWTPPQKVEGMENNTWLWRVTWHKGVGYGAVYTTQMPNGKRLMQICKTVDGMKYEKIAEPTPGINLSEYTIRFGADDSMIILLRGEEKDRHAWVGVATPPYQKFEWKDGGVAAQGPNFIVLGDGRMVYGGRDYTKGVKTAVGWMTRDGLKVALTFESGGDNSYPGIVEAEKGLVWVSFYSSHEGKAAIYLAKVRVE